MLVCFYIVSVVTGLLAAIFLEKEHIILWFFSAIIAILSGIAFCLPMIEKIYLNLDNISFKDIFWVLSIIGWQLAMLTGNWWNVVNYEFGFALCTITILLICSTAKEPPALTPCSSLHVTNEIVEVLVSINQTGIDNSTYGDGFIIKKVISTSSQNRVYKYFYRLEDGTICEGTILQKSTEIYFIDTSEQPYLEIISTSKCSGYDPKLDKHYLKTTDKLYKLYIPEGCILTVFEND